MLRLLLSVFTLGLLLPACQPAESPAKGATATNPAPASAPTVDLAADDMLSRSFRAHGGPRYENANYRFVFREKTITYKRIKGKYRYTSTYEKEGQQYFDVIDEGKFTRQIDGVAQELNTKDYNGGFEDLNSIVYFATLPNKLRDPAVYLSSEKATSIKGKKYDVLRVSFAKEGGGVDHDDNFMYWINKETDRIDYLAYDYKTNKGGVRFRSAFNPRVVGGILFQDYVNYKAPLGTALSDLPAMYEADALEELSIIATEDVVRLN